MPSSTRAASGSKFGGSLGHLTVIVEAALVKPAGAGVSAGESSVRSGVTLVMVVSLSVLMRLDR
jgi:hypothetical protein